MSDSLSSCPGAIGGELGHVSLHSVKDDYRWARFFRELAGILVLFHPGQGWVRLLRQVGLSKDDIEEVTRQDLDPEIQAYKLLNKSRGAQQGTADWWESFRREVIAEEDQNLTENVDKAYHKFISGDVVDSSDSDRSLPSPSSFQATGSPTHSPATTPPPCLPKTTQSFEVIKEEEVIKSSEEIKLKLKEEIEISDPEVSQQIENIRRVIQEVAGKSPQMQISLQLAQAVSETLKMENSFRATQTLKDLLERESQFNKQEKERLAQELEAKCNENQALKQEVEELKKTNEDKNLSGFDVITKREARESAEKKESSSHVAAGTPEEGMINISAYHDLQARCIKVTGQRDQLIKVNHQWDTEYHNMEKALRSEIQKIDQEVMARNEEIMAGKRLIADLEKEKTDAINLATGIVDKYDTLKKKYEGEKGKCRKFHEYALRLSQQKDKLEREISRLNTVLSQEKQKTSRKAAPTGQDFENEVALYKQQAEIFENDFRDEHRENRRLVGELEATKEELHTVKDRLKRMTEKVQMSEDERIARQLQTGRSPLIAQQPRDLAPRGVNYAGNDRFVDMGPLSSFGSIEADGVDGGDRSPPGEREPNQCPRCEAVIDDEEVFMNHLGPCLDRE